MSKVLSSKPQVGKVKTDQTIGGFTVISPKLKTKQKQTNNQTNKATKLDANARRRGQRSVHGYNTNVLMQEFNTSTI